MEHGRCRSLLGQTGAAWRLEAGGASLQGLPYTAIQGPQPDPCYMHRLLIGRGLSVLHRRKATGAVMQLLRCPARAGAPVATISRGQARHGVVTGATARKSPLPSLASVPSLSSIDVASLGDDAQPLALRDVRVGLLRSASGVGHTAQLGASRERPATCRHASSPHRLAWHPKPLSNIHQAQPSWSWQATAVLPAHSGAPCPHRPFNAAQRSAAHSGAPLAPQSTQIIAVWPSSAPGLAQRSPVAAPARARRA